MKEHPKFKGYLVTEYGKVFTCHKKRSNGKGKIESYIDYNNPKELKLKKHPTNGYVYAKNKRVHRLVAELYIPNPNNLSEVNHIDKNKENNSIHNLEWVDRQKNAEHSLSKYYTIENIQTGEIFEVFNLSKFSRENDLHNGCLHDTLTQRNGIKQHKGFRIIKRGG
jgi:hypothetical protein